jgi:hypothetical protein
MMLLRQQRIGVLLADALAVVCVTVSQSVWRRAFAARADRIRKGSLLGPLLYSCRQ